MRPGAGGATRSIANVEFPRLGFIRLRAIDALLSHVRQRMG